MLHMISTKPDILYTITDPDSPVSCLEIGGALSFNPKLSAAAYNEQVIIADQSVGSQHAVRFSSFYNCTWKVLSALESIVNLHGLLYLIISGHNTYHTLERHTITSGHHKEGDISARPVPVPLPLQSRGLHCLPGTGAIVLGYFQWLVDKVWCRDTQS